MIRINQTRSNRMISLEPLTKNRDIIDLDATNPNLLKSCDRDSRVTTQSTNYYVDLLDTKFHRARIEFCR